MRILLIQPNVAGAVGFSTVAMPEPLHLETVAATVPEHDLRILDMRLDGDLAMALTAFQPNMVAVTALTPEVYAAQEILHQVKSFCPDILTVAGGHHATLVPSDFFLPQVDAVLLGEAEVVFNTFARAVESGQDPRDVPNAVWRDRHGMFVANERTAERADLSDVPFPRRDLTESYRSEYFFLFDRPDTSVATSRGCPFRCKFCSVHEFYGGTTNQMPPRRVVDELGTVRTDHVTFVDDNFLMNASRETELADMIQSEGIHKRFSMECRTDSIVRHPELVEKWVDIGLYAVLLGLEGGSEDVLETVNKSCSVETNNRAIQILQDNGVIIWGAFIIDPDWADDDFKRLQEYLSDRQITHTQFTILTPLPGTPLFRERYEDLLTHDYSCFDTLHAVLPTRLPREKFYQNFAALYRQHDIGPYYDLVRAGKMSVADCRRGKAMLDAMATWERYVEKDPILGPRHTRTAKA